MDDPILSREFGWTESSESDVSDDPLADEVDSDFQSSEEDEVPFARHGPLLEADTEELSMQREFWGHCAIGFILDYRRFSVSHLQHLISSAWRIRGDVKVVGRDSSFYILHFEYLEDLNHMCSEGPWSVDGALLILEKWRPNLVISNLQVNYIAIWVQFHGLPVEYQYPKLAERMGQCIGVFERLDWEDRLPRNIRFMHVRVRIDPWLPVVTRFMLQLDDGSRVWIQCRYERIHKLYIKCGMIGHTRGQCTHSMDNIEMMLVRQRFRIQSLQQVRFRFDALKPHFTNDLQAFYNQRRRWTTWVRFGNLSDPHHSPPHLPVNSPDNHSHQSLYPDPITPPNESVQHHTIALPPHATHTPATMHANLHFAINSLNLDHDTLPPNLPFSLEAIPPRHAHPFSLPRPNHASTSSFSLRPPWVLHTSTGLKWTWIGQDGPKWDLRDTTQDSSETESESLTETLFNLDSLNESRPEAMQGTRWMHGQIPESPDSVIPPLVQRVNRGRLRFEVGDSSLGPRLFGPHV